MKKLILVIIVVVIAIISFPFIKDFISGYKAGSEYQEKINTFDKSSVGNYKECLNLEIEKDRQFCLWLAGEEFRGTELCDLMSPSIYPPDHMYSQDNCYIDQAIFAKDQSVCNKVIQKDKCNIYFK